MMWEEMEGRLAEEEEEKRSWWFYDGTQRTIWVVCRFGREMRR